MLFEELFAKTDNEKILDKLEEIKQLMIPKVVYVPYPVYIDRSPYYVTYPSPVEYVYPEKYDCVDALRYAFPEEFKTYYGIDFAEHACLSSVCVST